MVFSWSSFSYPSVFPFKSLVFICWVSSWCNVSRLFSFAFSLCLNFLKLFATLVLDSSHWVKQCCKWIKYSVAWKVICCLCSFWRTEIPERSEASKRWTKSYGGIFCKQVFVFFLIYFFISSLNSYIKLYSHHDYFLDWLFLRV